MDDVWMGGHFFFVCLFFFFFHWVLIHPANLPIAEGFIKSVWPQGSKIGTHPTRWPQNTKTRGGEYQWGGDAQSHHITCHKFRP